MILFYVSLLAIGVITAFCLDWRSILLFSFLVVGAAYAAMVIGEKSYAFLHAALGLLVLQLSYVVAGVGIAVVRAERRKAIGKTQISE